MSSGAIPATSTGAVIASRRKGSPSSWLRMTSIKVVTPCFWALQDSFSAEVSSDWVVTATPFSPHPSATLAKLKSGFNSVPTKLLSYQRMELRFSAPHW